MQHSHRHAAVSSTVYDTSKTPEATSSLCAATKHIYETSTSNKQPPSTNCHEGRLDSGGSLRWCRMTDIQIGGMVQRIGLCSSVGNRHMRCCIVIGIQSHALLIWGKIHTNGNLLCNCSQPRDIPLRKERSPQEELAKLEDCLSMDARVKQQPWPLDHELGWTTM